MFRRDEIAQSARGHGRHVGPPLQHGSGLRTLTCRLATCRDASVSLHERERASHRYGRIVTFFIVAGVTGLLMPPSAPSVVGVSAIASTAAMLPLTFAKIT